MNKVEVYGYSERGIFNSIVFYFGVYFDKIPNFLKTLEIEDETIYEQEVKYTFLVEQSFSDFGSCDLVIIAENQQKKSKIVVFIEGKVKTSQVGFSLEQQFLKLKDCNVKFKGISSNIFVQLYYKYLLIKIIQNNIDETTNLIINDIFKKDKNNERKIGNNKIVLKAIEKIRNATKIYYVAILPEYKQSSDFQHKYLELNKTIFIDEQIPINNVRSVYWANVEKLFTDDVVKGNFLYNEGQIY